jgi:hypothetical protein
MMQITQAEAEISVIKKIMDDSRRIAVYNGKHYILWGVLVSIALFANYVMVLMHIELNYQGFMWFILMISGAITGSIMERMEHRKKAVRTFAGKLLSTLWFASGIAMFMFGFLGTIVHAYDPIFICPIIFTILGVSYYTSGEIQQTGWFKYLSFGWWAGAVLLFIFPGIHTLLISGLMMLGLQTIPGIILYRKWKKEIEVTSHSWAS